MAVKKIEIKNLKLIKHLIIEPGKITQVVGENNNGKTTVLEAIEFGMAGSTDPSIIRHGAEVAEVHLTFDDGLQVERKLAKCGNQTLKVSVHGLTPQRPQSYLNRFLGVGTFNPRDVLDPKKRNDYILKAINVKVTKEGLQAVAGDEILPEYNYADHGFKVLDRAAKYFYDTRTVVNREVKDGWAKLKANRDQMVAPPKSTLDGSGEDLMEARRQYQEELNGLRSKHTAWAENKKGIDGLESDIQAAMKALDVLEVRRSELSEVGQEPDVVAESDRLTKSINAINEEASIRREIKSYEGQILLLDDMETDCELKEKRSKDLTAIHHLLSKKMPNDLVAKAELPVEGLTFEDGVFRVDGDEVDQLSSSRALKLALGITKSLNKKASMICIDGAEILDEDTYASLHEEMAKDQFTYFLAKVGSAFKQKDVVVNMIDGAAV